MSAGWYPSDVSRPPYPHFEDDPRAEMEEERAAFADWRRDQNYAADRPPGYGREPAIVPDDPFYGDATGREEARAVALRKMFGVV